MGLLLGQQRKLCRKNKAAANRAHNGLRFGIAATATHVLRSIRRLRGLRLALSGRLPRGCRARFLPPSVATDVAIGSDRAGRTTCKNILNIYGYTTAFVSTRSN